MGRRRSATLPLEAGANLLDAWRFAEHLDQRPNYFLTVHLAKLDGGGDPIHREARWRERMSKWLRERSRAPTWLWWREHGHLAGEHFHMLLHLPAELADEFETMARFAWVGDGEPEAIDLRPANGDEAMIGYALKDMTRRDWRALDLSQRLWSHYRKLAKASTKPIDGKRAGTTENIGLAARARYYGEIGITVQKPVAAAQVRKLSPSGNRGPQKPMKAAQALVVLRTQKRRQRPSQRRGEAI